MRNGQKRSQLSELTISSDQYINEEKYWLNKLGGEIEKSHFPYDSWSKQPDKLASGDFHFRLKGELFAKIIKSARGSDPRVHMILTAGLTALLYKYTGDTDIIVGTSIYKQEVEGEFINTVLALRHSLDHGMTFRELLKQVRQTAAEANENANYPIETLLYQLNMPASPNYFPFFDVAILLENIHDRRYLQVIKPNMVFNFSRAEESIEGEVEYNTSLYTDVSVEMVAYRFKFLLEKLLGAPDSIMKDIELVDETEKKQLIAGFNDTGRDYPFKKTLVRLFEEQVEKTMGKTVVVNIDGEELSYEELNERANRLAAFLREKGVGPDEIVGVMITEPLEMAAGLIAVLKAGGAYFPIDPEIPASRTVSMVKDVHCSLLITQRQVLDKYEDALSGIIPEIIVVDETDLRQQPAENPGDIISCHHLAYIIFTSGSTGSPKASAVEHRSVVNTLLHRKEEYHLDANVVSLQLFAITFDGFVTSFFSPIVSGSRVVLPAAMEILDMNRLKTAIVSYKVTHFICVPALYKVIMESLTPKEAASLKVVTLAGDILSPDIIGITRAKNPGIEIVNEYGVTEAGVMSTLLRHQESKREISIGKPVANTAIYILEINSTFRLQPVGIYGELCIAGVGIARGYLNNPQLTAEKFDRDLWDNQDYYNEKKKGNEKFLGVQGPFFKKVSDRRILYRTGDLARWLVDGNVEFLGRMDHQVKVRGFRIELGEIENQLVRLPEVGNAVVVKQDFGGEGHLVAYVVPAAGDFKESGNDRSQFIADLKNQAAARLPDYMVPSVFILMNDMPLTSSGKIDRKALPEPLTVEMYEHIPPGTETEKKLAALMSEVLSVNKDMIGANSNFFDLGGHSLRAITLTAKIHEAFDVKVPVGEIFSLQTVRALAVYLDRFKVDTENRYSSIEAVEAKEYYVLSSAQKRMYIVQQMHPQDTSNNMPQMIPLNRVIDKKGLEDTFNALIRRHESLRTSFVVIDEDPVERILSPGDLEFEIEYYVPATQSRGGMVEAYTRADSNTRNPGSNEKLISTREDIIRNFVRPFNLAEAPQLRAGLIKETEERYLLIVDMHHIISDAVSNEIVVKEFTALDARLALPELRLQYKDYAVWQNREDQEKTIKRQEAYWLEQFANGAPTLNFPTDFERPAFQDFDGDFVYIALEDELFSRLKTLAKETDTTMFMVILALFTILLSKYSGQEDIVVGTPISGRPHADLQDIIGMFVNMLSLRNVPAKIKCFTEFLQEVKNNCLDAYENQDYQYNQLVDKLGLWKVMDRNPVFCVCIVFQQMSVEIGPTPDVDNDVTDRSHDLGQFKTKYDLLLDCMEYKNGLKMNLEYKTSIFKPSTIETIINNFIEIITQVLENKDIQLGDISISTGILLAETGTEDEEVEFNF
jgi:amino acid adenylation domain-containing protein